MADAVRGVAMLCATGVVVLGATRALAQQPTVLTDQGNVRLESDEVEQPSCGGCQLASNIHILSYRVQVRAPAQWRIESVDAPDGGMSDLAISPDGTRAEARLRAAGRGARDLPVIATFVHARTSARGTITRTYDDYDSREVIRCVQSACADPTEPAGGAGAPGHASVEEASAPGIVLGRELALDNVRFAGEWPTRFRAIVVTRRGTPLAGGEASVSCSTGTASVTTRPGSPPTFAFSARTTTPRMVGGAHTCTLRVEPAPGARPLTGVFRFRIGATGDLSIVSARLRAAPTPRPDPRRLTPATP